MTDQSAPQEIVIVRRRGGGEDEGHHGGAWKIAYADFMTAMMAFFLVMWLVNAADKKVLTQVASYFNPLRMSERVSAKKGVEDLVQGAAGEVNVAQKKGKASATSDDKEEGAESSVKSDKTVPDAEKAEKKTAGDGGQTDMTEQELFNDPYGILEKLASQAIVGRQGGSEANSGTGRTETGGEAFRDPFDPEFSRSELKSATSDQKVVEAKQPSLKEGAQDSVAAKGLPTAADKQMTAKAATDGVKSAEAIQTSNDKQDQKKADQLKEKLTATLADLAPGQKPTLSVQATPDGLLISITDDFDFEMFRLSSAQPNKQLVAALIRVAGVLKGMPGRVIVRGHTDGRPFAKGTSDNWKLSSQRALMTRYMLIKGGIDEGRFVRVEGYADASLKVTADPLAAQNRRIELLLQKQ